MSGIRAAEVVLPCAELQATLAFFTERLGFRLESIFPADDPALAQVSGHGLRLRLERDGDGSPGVLRLECAEPSEVAGGEVELVAPNGTRVLLVSSAPALAVPPPRVEFAVNRIGSGAAWGEGRAGMRYRDLLPDRLGGFLVASHIRIEAGGPVPDYVHYHEVQFQLIYCHRGWARVVYEDQGPPFVLAAGDCVLQPPRIRHRVLESSAGLEVIELGVPAAHPTRVDHELVLPTATLRPARPFEGQRFVRHQRSACTWQPWRMPGFEARELGIERASGGLASVQVARVAASGPTLPATRAAFRFLFVLAGQATLTCEDRDESLEEGDTVLLPGELAHAFEACSRDLELLEVAFSSGACTAMVSAGPEP